MKKQLLFGLVGFLISSGGFAQAIEPTDVTTVAKDTVWRTSGAFGFKFNQVALTNWAAGGQNSMAWNATLDFKSDYKKGKIKWDNIIHLGYGLSKQGEDPLNKTDDQILINSNLGYNLNGPWYASLNTNFRTQFADGFNLPNDSVKVSGFMTPGYLVTAMAVEFKPSDDFVLLVTPFSNKTIFVMDDLLALKGAFGIGSASNVKAEFGAFVSIFYKKKIVKNVMLTTFYTLFGNYSELGAWDVNWDVILDFKINDFLSANLTTKLIYDQDIKTSVDRTGDGIKESFGPRVQFRQSLGIGLKLSFSD